jgi:hypothetical protein
MAELLSVQCGFCHRKFRVKSEQAHRQVYCPFCKTAVKVMAQSDVAREALSEMSDMIAQEKAEHDKRPITKRHQVVLARGGVRNKNVAIIWVTLLGLALIGAVVAIVMIYGGGRWREPAKASGILTIGSRTGPEAPPAGAAAAPPGAQAQVPESPPAAPGASRGAPEQFTDAVTVKFERSIGGFKDDTVTYAVGRVTNNTTMTLKVLRVFVTALDKDDKQIGEATQVILNLPPGATAPMVAEWTHEPQLRAGKWMPGYQLNPVGITQDLPPVTTDGALAMGDPNQGSMTGKIAVRLTNQGLLPVPQVLAYAILLGDDGHIIGCVKNVLDVKGGLLPKKAAEVTIPWERCARRNIQSVEIWVQPTF